MGGRQPLTGTASRFRPVGVPDAAIAHAKQIRAERDRRYANYFEPHETDDRWVGDLGELVARWWLARSRPVDLEALDRGDVHGLPDLVLEGVAIGVKTAVRTVDPRPHYFAPVNAPHIDEPVAEFLFLSYNVRTCVMWILGGMARARFRELARFYPAGSVVPPAFRVSAPGVWSGVPISALTPPDSWLVGVRGR